MRSLCLFALLAACSSDSGGADAPGSRDAYDTVTCKITGSYGDLGAKAGTTAQGPTTLTVVLDAGPPRDSFFLKLNTGKGAFSTGLTSGMFAISGVDADFSNCGLCVNIIADIVTMQGPTKFYFADAGMVTLTSTSPPIGSAANLTFHEVTSAGARVQNGCVASIKSMSFSM